MSKDLKFTKLLFLKLCDLATLREFHIVLFAKLCELKTQSRQKTFACFAVKKHDPKACPFHPQLCPLHLFLPFKTSIVKIPLTKKLTDNQLIKK